MYKAVARNCQGVGLGHKNEAGVMELFMAPRVSRTAPGTCRRPGGTPPPPGSTGNLTTVSERLKVEVLNFSFANAPLTADLSISAFTLHAEGRVFETRSQQTKVVITGRCFSLYIGSVNIASSSRFVIGGLASTTSG